MKKTEFLTGLSCFLLSLAILLSVIDTCCFNRSFYEMEYQKNDTSAYTGMRNEDNLRATMTLLDYLRGKRDDIVVEAEVNGVRREVFNERETMHMVDVRSLYRKAILFRNLTLGLAVILFAWLLSRRKSFRSILREGFIRGNLAILMLVAGIAVWALADFNAFWTNFHLLFFDNDLWLLDPNTSIMINLFPGSFFFDLVIQIITAYLILMAAIAAYAYVPRRRTV